MDDQDSLSHLFGELSEKAETLNIDELKSTLLPVKFETRTPLERFRSLVLEGYLPTFFCVLFLAYMGSQLLYPYTPLWLALMYIPVGAVLALLLGPLFQFHNLRRGRDILWIFALGLVTAATFSLMTAALTPAANRLSFAVQAAHTFDTASAPVTALAFLLLTISVCWGIKLWARKVLSESPWFDMATAGLGVQTLRLLILWSPLGLYLALYMGSLPSNTARQFISRAETLPQSVWLPRYSVENQNLWDELSRRHGVESYRLARAPKEKITAYLADEVNLIKDGKLPPRDSWAMKDLLRDELDSGAWTPQLTRVAVFALPVGLARGEKIGQNHAVFFLTRLLERNGGTDDELKTLDKDLGDLISIFPKPEEVLENTLLQVSTPHYSAGGTNYWLISWLKENGVGPEQLAVRRWAYKTAEQYMALRAQTGDSGLETASKEEFDALDGATRPLFLDTHVEANGLLSLTEAYRQKLFFLQTAVRLRLYRREHGRFPETLLPLGVLSSQFEYGMQNDGTAVLSEKKTGDAKATLRLEP